MINKGTPEIIGTWNHNELDGLIKQFHENGKYKYVGYYKKNQKSGYGIEYSKSTGWKIYEGQYAVDRWNGYGRSFNENGYVKWEGVFQRNTYHGDGILYDNYGNFQYSGTWRDNYLMSVSRVNPYCQDFLRDQHKFDSSNIFFNEKRTC